MRNGGKERLKLVMKHDEIMMKTACKLVAFTNFATARAREADVTFDSVTWRLIFVVFR